MKLVENTIIKYSEKRIIRVLYYDDFNRNIIVVDLLENKWPYTISIDEITKDIKNKESKIVEEDRFNIMRERKLTEAETKGRDLAWEIISYIFQEVEEPYIYYSKYRTSKIHEATDRYKVSFSTIRNYLIKYWKAGKILDSLIPEFSKCGARGIERKSGDKKRGRPTLYGKKMGVNIDSKIKKMFTAGLNKYYYNNRQNTLRVAYELTIRDNFISDYIIEGDKKVPVFDKTKIPSYNQFYYWYKKFNNDEKEITTRQGKRIFSQNYRGIIGSSTEDADLGPASLWQIDSTIADVYLVSSINRNLIIGRPVLYFIVDVYSRILVGMNVTIESFNSYTGAKMALLNAMTPKLEYCKKFGVDIEKKDWNTACIPQRILADRGELMSKNIENAIKNLGISIQNTPPYKADYKGIIEQSFRGINLKLKPFVDGVVINSKLPRQRGEQDYRLNSNLTLEEFTKIVIKCLLFHNNHHVLSEYVTSEMMFENNVEKIPIKIWQHGLENKSGMLRQLPENIIKMNLLPSGEATVTERGILFKRLLYASKNTLKEGWYQKARTQGSWKIKVSYDSRDLSNIYIIDDEGRNFEKLSLLDYLSKYKNIGIVELDEIYKYEKEREIESKDNEMEEKIILFNDIEEVVNRARKESELQKDNNLNKTQRLKDIRENKDMEKELHRRPIVLETEELERKEDKEEKIEDKNSDDLDIFRQVEEVNDFE